MAQSKGKRAASEMDSSSSSARPAKSSGSRAEARKSHTAATLSKKRAETYTPLLSQRLGKSSNFVVPLPFSNDLPRPTLGPVFLAETTRTSSKLIDYSYGKVESHNPIKLAIEATCGVEIETNDPTVYEVADTSAVPPMHPADDEIVNWKGYLGDSNMDALLRKRSGATSKATTSHLAPQVMLKNRSNTRVLDESKPFFMKSTTYLTNATHKRVHQFKNLAQQREEEKKNLIQELEKRESDRGPEAVERAFDNVAKPLSSLRHGKNPSLKAVRSWSVLPLVATWSTPYVASDLPLISESDDMSTAIITDVERKGRGGNEGRLACNVIVKDKENALSDESYVGYQTYDLEVVPLKEEGYDSNFVFVMDNTNNTCFYHPLTSRVVLTNARNCEKSGKPVNVTRNVATRDMDDAELMEWKHKQGPMDEDMCEREGWSATAAVAE